MTLQPLFATTRRDGALPRRRRLLFAASNGVLLGLGTAALALRLGPEAGTLFGLTVLGLFMALLAPVVYGFTQAVAGWWVLRRGGDPLGLNRTLPPDAAPAKWPAVAIVMPIFNEDVSRVFQGLQVMHESARALGRADAFDWFVLSDTNDTNTWVAEERAWFELCKRVHGFGRIFYRKRRLAAHFKSGNIADFCRRWGANYEYMIVLDADSIMTGPALVRLVSLMEQNPHVGIIQTNSRIALGRSLFQRINQFANRVYGPLFAAGASFWQLDTANFWGHNAIVRLKPFMKHCAMPELPRTGPLGTRILSHDMVEAAFMRRAGWEVWLAWDLEGSYEETPPHLEASLQRDRRWCHGNLQHFWFLCGSGLKTASRLNILLGIMAYLSAPLWLLFLLFSPALFFVDDARAAPMEGGQGTALLAGAVLVLLLAPKILGLSLLLKRPGDLKGCGGRARVAAGVAAETIFSAILAPLLMLFYTRFVCSSLSGAAITWGRQRRRDEGGSSWRELIAAHGGHMILALSWGGAVAWLTPPLLPWLAPVLLGPIFAIPFSRVTASTRLGRRAAERGWFLVPEEARPLTEFRRLSEPFTEPDGLFRATLYSANFGLLQAVLDPYVNAIHVLLLRQRPHVSLRTREYLTALTDRLLWDGPFALTPREKRLLLWDADAMQAAHVKLWGRPSSHLHEWWQAAFRHYNESRVLEVRRSVSS